MTQSGMVERLISVQGPGARSPPWLIEREPQPPLRLAADAFGTAPWGTLGGIAISAADVFLFEKLISGWKPHQFVEGELKTLFLADQRPREATKCDI